MRKQDIGKSREYNKIFHGGMVRNIRKSGKRIGQIINYGNGKTQMWKSEGESFKSTLKIFEMSKEGEGRRKIARRKKTGVISEVEVLKALQKRDSWNNAEIKGTVK